MPELGSKNSTENSANDETLILDKQSKVPDGDSEPTADQVEGLLLKGPWRILRYPDRSAILLELTGIAIALSAWMPLLTIPGLFVLFKWEIADLEDSRIHFDGKKVPRLPKEVLVLDSIFVLNPLVCELELCTLTG